MHPTAMALNQCIWLQISIFRGVDFFDIAVAGWTNYVPSYPGSTVRCPLAMKYVEKGVIVEDVNERVPPSAMPVV